MKKLFKGLILFLLALLMSCGGKEEKKEGFSVQRAKTETKTKEKVKENTTPASKRIALESKGVGPVTSLEIPADIDAAMVSMGQEVFKSKCTACHRANKKFIGPSPQGILERRSPEWVMNMILNPDEMVQKDALAKDLLIEFNGSPMANQNLTQQDARAVLEYFRTL